MIFTCWSSAAASPSKLQFVQPLGASDYLEMSRLFDTVFIRHIPQLNLNRKTQARRLITLVDALYEQKVRRHLQDAVLLLRRRE